MSRFGVGFLGSGPVAQAIHVPFAKRFPKDLRVASFMDVAPELIEKLGKQHGATWTTDEDELINDPTVDVVVIGSPNAHHARQILKSCVAGKRVILAEKPFAVTVSELQAIKAAADASGTSIIVGTMHAFDESFLKALEYWRILGAKAHTVEVNCYLPTNDEMVSYATQLISPEPHSHGSGTPPDLKELLAGGALGLAMHDIPGVREFAPLPISLKSANYVSPWGFLFQGESEGVVVRFVGQMPGAWGPDWSMTVTATDAVLHVDFRPSYVDSGSAIVTVTTAEGVRVFQSNMSPYTSEWQEIVSLLNNVKEPIYSLDRICDDLSYALDIVDQFENLGL